MNWTKDFRKAVVEWDLVNWSRAVDFWNIEALCGGEPFRALDLGARSGGLSLLLAACAPAEDANILCTDLTEPSKTAGPLHQKFGVDSRISYAALDATALDACEEYDVICFKSVLGGIGHHDNREAQQTAIHNCYRALKPGGYLVFAENLVSSGLHQALRKRFNAWSYWRYITIAEALSFCGEFSQVDYRCFGFLGTFGRSERQRSILGHVDRCFDRFLPEDQKYIISVVARK